MNGTDNPFDKEAWFQRKQEERRAVYDMADRAATAVAGGGAPLSAFLDVQARFDRYSATNALLIFAQMPQAHFDQEKQIIFVRKGMDTEDIFCSVSRELAHAELARQNPEYNRGSKGFAAFCASHILCRKFGISVENHPIGMLPDVTLREDPQAIRRMLSEARDAAGTISARMVRTLERSTRPREQGR